MLSVDEALARILQNFRSLSPEPVPVALALGRTLAQDIQAGLDLPPFANSSMDGFAVRAEDVANASKEHPVSLHVIGDIPAGSHPDFSVGPGQAARILTGAPIPDGADCVVPVEQTDSYLPAQPEDFVRVNIPIPTTVAIYKGGTVGDCIRPVGEDIQEGQIVLHAGRQLRAADLGVLIGLGYAEVLVFRRPVIAVIATGDELLEVDVPLAPGKIRDVNSYTIAALAQRLGARAIRLGIARDTLDDVIMFLRHAIDIRADLIISTAGVSVGAFDIVKQAVESMGELNFWKVNMRPGKPLIFGHVQDIPYFGLPGNPVSAMVTFDVFARPAILRMSGRLEAPNITYAEVGEAIKSDGRRTYARVTLRRNGDHLVAFSTGNQSSGVLSSLVYADGLMIIPEGVTDIPTGTLLPVRLFAEDI